jgi:glycosyltransferase involved in cell wall biosynthesis
MIELSFVVIAYNEEKNLAKAVSSIKSLHQLPQFEIVIVNDGSTDKTSIEAQLLSQELQEIRVINFESNCGRGAARSAGLAATEGATIAFIDADVVLPVDWWIQTSAGLLSADACGGVAVPDGDVAFVHRILDLRPRIRPHTTAVTGCNGLFKRSVFNKVWFDETKRNGEDVDLGHQMKAAGLIATSIPWLIVEHSEKKSFRNSLSWLYESGIGAAHQFVEHKIWRVPDLATLSFVLVVISATGLWLSTSAWLGILLALIFLLASSAAQMVWKFHYKPNAIKFLAGIAVQSTLLLSYFAGRTVGFLVHKKVRKDV